MAHTELYLYIYQHSLLPQSIHCFPLQPSYKTHPYLTEEYSDILFLNSTASGHNMVYRNFCGFFHSCIGPKVLFPASHIFCYLVVIHSKSLLIQNPCTRGQNIVYLIFNPCEHIKTNSANASEPISLYHFWLECVATTSFNV